MGFDADFVGGHVKAWGTVDTVGVEQRHGGHLEVLAHANEFLGQGRAFEEAECGAGVKFYIQVLSTQYSVLSKNRNPNRVLSTKY